ncbi:MAG: hypothetical protein PVF05_12965 [Gemmatimonadales bacterium]
MGAGGLIPVALAALAAAAVSWWAYARLEERVPGRAGPAVLRALALFFLLAGWWLPPLWTAGAGGRATRAVLVDRSLSMSLPVTPGGPSRADSAGRLAASLDADVVRWFGDSARAPETDDEGTGPSDEASRVVPAFEAARAAGADSVVLVTDGELDDRELARGAARRLGLAVREVRIGASTGRLAINRVEAPATAEAGDSLRLVVEVAAVGDSLPADSASLSVAGPDGVRTIVRFPVPAPGRTMRVPFHTIAPDGGEAWRAWDVRLEADADPLAAGARHRVWVEVVPTAAGTVVVAVDPDWEPHYLLPVLGRSTAGGARAWLRVGTDRWIRSGTDRVVTGDAGRVRADAARARLLVVQGDPAELPGWLRDVATRHPRVLWLVRGPGAIPGSAMRVGPVRPGEWYPGGAPPPSPVAGYLDGLDDPGLPPVARLFTLEGYDWAPVELRRNRTGTGQPPIGAGRNGGRRRVVVAAEGLWRWASRAGEARQAYRSLFAGLAGWLLEAPERRPLELERPRLVAGDTIRWRVAAGVSGVRIAVRDSTGEVVWADTLTAPDTLVSGPAAPAGSLRYEADGTVSGESFRVGRPFEAEGAERELGARPVGAPLLGAATGGGAAPGGGHAVWPFVLAALMLCGEWFWRRRIGLR